MGWGVQFNAAEDGFVGGEDGGQDVEDGGVLEGGRVVHQNGVELLLGWVKNGLL